MWTWVKRAELAAAVGIGKENEKTIRYHCHRRCIGNGTFQWDYHGEWQWEWKREWQNFLSMPLLFLLVCSTWHASVVWRIRISMSQNTHQSLTNYQVTSSLCMDYWHCTYLPIPPASIRSFFHISWKFVICKISLTPIPTCKAFHRPTLLAASSSTPLKPTPINRREAPATHIHY